MAQGAKKLVDVSTTFGGRTDIFAVEVRFEFRRLSFWDEKGLLCCIDGRGNWDRFCAGQEVPIHGDPENKIRLIHTTPLDWKELQGAEDFLRPGLQYECSYLE
jgi:hypothetical protein